MKILALDIGAGTEDVLLYDDAKKSVENCLKMVLPAPTQVYAAQVKAATRLGQDLFIKGDTIGGGAISIALRKHVEAGFPVTMTEQAAYTVRNDLDEVREAGINILSTEAPTEFQGKTLSFREVNLTTLQAFLAEFNEPLSDVDVVAIAVQDHGVSPRGMSNRRFRIQTMKDLLERDPRIEALVFREDAVPSCFLRMQSAVRASKRQLPKSKVVVMDTAPAAILGCLADPAVKGIARVLAVNVGNGHTMAALLEDEEIVGVLEHHTQLLNPQKIDRLLVAFADGRMSNEEVFRDRGHGSFLLKEPMGFSTIETIAVTGPNR
ncbi:MAG: DUF1786 domain-containing protein, partial [Candidatus Bathyarchaeota archaeon]|nr:DUF1786 domain-containing protein [Candidatus Bathyarchaeota archaeon]